MPHVDRAIPIVLDKPRALMFELENLMRAEEELCRFWGRDVNLIQVMIDPEHMPMNTLAILLWQGLITDDPRLRLADVRRLMSFHQYGEILTKVYEAWNAHTESAEPAQGTPNGPLSSVSPGETTGASPALSLASVTTNSGI